MSGQQANLPTIIVWLQALSVPCLGALAAWIAFQQWRTADRKVQLDLFDRRWAIYSDTRAAVQRVVQTGKVGLDEYFAYLRAIDRAELLYGDEVVAQFTETRRDIENLMRHLGDIEGGPPYPPAAIAGRAENMRRVATFFEKMPPLLEPYLRIAHKAPTHPLAAIKRFRRGR